MSQAASSKRISLLPKGRWIKWGLWAFLVATLIGGLSFVVLWSRMSREADAFLVLFAQRTPKTITKVLDRNGDVIGIFSEEHRVLIPYGDLPKAFVNALVATEDADFWNHGGISPRGFLRAGMNFVTSFGRKREGASTLTMQLVRSVTNRRQKTVNRKLLEIAIARKLEKAYSKKEILQAYANEVYFGGGRFGVEAAAQYYFEKSAPQLTVEECALLAGLVQSPNWYNPYNPDPRARAAARQRRNVVLRRMADENYLKEADARVLMERPIRLARGNGAEAQVSPYAVEEVRKYLYDRFGRETVINGGLEVHTTIDSVWQVAANQAVRKGLKTVDRRRGYRKAELAFTPDPETAKLPGWTRFFEPGDSVKGVVLGWSGSIARVRIGTRTLEVPEAAFAWAGKEIQKLFPRGATPLFQVVEAGEDGVPRKLELDQEPEVEGALLAVEPGSGEIRAMVGGYDFARSKFNRSVQAERQVGSTMKAFVYGAAFTQGKTPASLVEDVPTQFLFSVERPYEPKNYERNYWGPIPIWEALRDSRNVPAVRTLDEVGIEYVSAFARACGVEGNLRPFPSLALGAADLTLRDMVRGYATIANGGVQAPSPFLITKIVDRSGKVLESFQGQPGEVVVDPMSNYQLIQCLQGVTQRGTAARANELNWPVAGKTGTTDEYTDAWFLGFSTRLTCGVWVGLDTKKTLFRPGADGGRVALPIWIDFMKAALPGTPREEFPVPEGMEFAEIDRVTGLLASSVTDAKDLVRLAFKPGTVPRSGSSAEALEEIRAAREKAPTQPIETRDWGTPKALEPQAMEPADILKAEPPK